MGISLHTLGGYKMRELIIITGQTGVNIGGALDKLCKSLGTNYEKMDRFLKAAHIRKYPKDPDNEMISTPSGTQYLLSKPKNHLRALWKEAWSSCLSQACESTDSQVFVAMHAVSYHSESKEFFSCTDVKHLSNECKANNLKIKKVVTLVDDIYDVYRRLSEPGQLFEPVVDPRQVDPFISIIDAIQNFILLLTWRSMENLTVEQIANELEIPHYILATKHPISVAHSLIASKKIPIYLSHPISGVRSLKKEGESNKAKKIMSEIQELTTSLKNSNLILPFCPTTIDELIIATDKFGKYVPVFKERWPFGKVDEVLFVEPANPTLNPLDPNNSWKDIIRRSKEKTEAISAFLSHLYDWISAETNARDRKLVEQSGALVVYRPYFNGAKSEGVLHEITHRTSLVKFGVCAAAEKKCFVFSPYSDLGKWRITELISKHLADKAIDNRGKTLTKSDLRPLQKQLQKKEEVINELAQRNIGGDRLKKLVLSESRISSFIDIPSYQHPLDGVRGTKGRMWLATRWSEIADKLSKADVVSDNLYKQDVYLTESLTPAQFVKEIEKRIIK
jgi:hypothetical protein